MRWAEKIYHVYFLEQKLCSIRSSQEKTFWWSFVNENEWWSYTETNIIQWNIHHSVEQSFLNEFFTTSFTGTNIIHWNNPSFTETVIHWNVTHWKFQATIENWSSLLLYKEESELNFNQNLTLVSLFSLKNKTKSIVNGWCIMNMLTL